MTLLIDTRMDAPSADWIKEQHSLGFEVLHLPALEMIPLKTNLDFKGVDVVFLASPRAARLVGSELKNFNGPIWAVGKTTAAALRGFNVNVSEVGDGQGAFFFLSSLCERYDGKLPGSVLAWVSAEETAVDLSEIASEFQLEIRHFPVYRSIFIKYEASFINALPKIKTWHFYSGRALESLASLITEGDVVQCFGKSAEQKKSALSIS